MPDAAAVDDDDDNETGAVAADVAAAAFSSPISLIFVPMLFIPFKKKLKL
jgi:hypothetical protein